MESVVVDIRLPGMETANSQATDAMQSGKTITTVGYGDPQNGRPPVFADNIMPIVVAGETVGAARIYIDQTREAWFYNSNFSSIGLALAVP